MLKNNLIFTFKIHFRNNGNYLVDQQASDDKDKIKKANTI